MSSSRVHAEPGAPVSSRPKKTNHACRRCRERKVKCSSDHPCRACVNRREDCVFEHEDKKVTVSERYLAELKRRSGEDGETSRSKRTRHAPVEETGGTLPRDPAGFVHGPGQPEDLTGDAHTGSKSSESVPAIINPLASGLAEFVTDNNGRRCFLGPSSTWAYSQQVMHMIKRHLPNGETMQVPFNPDGSAFVIESPTITPVGPLTMQQLPSLDLSLYLVNTVKFRLGQLYHVFDEQTFIPKLYDFYSKGGPSREPPLEDRLWFVQYLTVMGIGHALLYEFIEEKPAGFVLIARALELLPDILYLYKDPLLSIEILCGLALYLQCIDHRNSAYGHIGLALRLSLSKGLHREMESVDMNNSETQRRHAIWWTVYILDRKLSSLMGAPTSVHDEDVTAPLPALTNALTAKGLGVHVRVSRLLAKVVNYVFVPFDLESTFACAFVLSLMSTLPSVPAQDIFYVDISFAILNYMIQRGNRVAEYRKGELENLFGFLEALRNSIEQVDHVDHGDNTIESAQTSELTATRTDSASFHPSGPGTDSLQSTLAPLNGLSPDTMLSIAGLLDWQPPQDDFLKYPSSSDWLWAEPHDLHYSAETGSNAGEDSRSY
ncbi:hypothetical protein E8E14_005142 [Neopestalotiopsis sp. 37M]|nr:hypothetical protein E8E14_005142 [Neopestalotiopsis sp. 37M]